MNVNTLIEILAGCADVDAPEVRSWAFGQANAAQAAKERTVSREKWWS
jgi:hypothetical protein